MRRRLLVLPAVAPVLVAGALLVGTPGASPAQAGDGASGGGRVDVIFDTAKGIVPGQVVKVAGARVGFVDGVALTSDYKARLQLDVDPRFVPFRADARCEIQPEGLISENFVQCDPGTADAPELRADASGTPTVPLGRTSVPVNLTDLFEIWEAPVRDRLRLLLNTLGAGVAGQGEELNRLLRRTNPTLGLVRRAVGVVDAQRDDLQDALVQAEAVGRELQRRPERLQAFVSEGAAVLGTTANRRAELRAGLRRLPPALAATRPALTALDALAEQGAPVARRLAAAAPELDGLLAAVPAASGAALPALRALGTTADRARPTVRAARPVVRRLRRFTAVARPTAAVLAPLLTNLRDRGFSESFLSFAYFAAAATARYDATSHIFPANVNQTECGTFATTTTPGCDANYTRTGATATARSAPDPARPAQRRRRAGGAPAPVAAPAAPGRTPAGAPRRPGLPQLPVPTPGPDPATSAAGELLDLLLGP